MCIRDSGCEDGLELGFTQIPYADLQDPHDPIQPVHNVVEDGGVGPGEALEGRPEIGVGIEVEDTHTRVARGAGIDRTERSRVVATQDDRQVPGVEGALGPRTDPVVQFGADLIYPLACRDQLRVALDRAARLEDRVGEA